MDGRGFVCSASSIAAIDAAGHLAGIPEYRTERFHYVRTTSRFYATSGVRDGMIIYRRCNFSSEADRRVGCVQLEYPQAEKRAWDKVDISAASPGHPDTPFALMSRAPANLPVKSWEPAFEGKSPPSGHGPVRRLLSGTTDNSPSRAVLFRARRVGTSRISRQRRLVQARARRWVPPSGERQKHQCGAATLPASWHPACPPRPPYRRPGRSGCTKSNTMGSG